MYSVICVGSLILLLIIILVIDEKSKFCAEIDSRRYDKYWNIDKHKEVWIDYLKRQAMIIHIQDTKLTIEGLFLVGNKIYKESIDIIYDELCGYLVEGCPAAHIYIPIICMYLLQNS